MTDHRFQDDFNALRTMYGDLVREHGTSPQAVQHKDLESQENRMRALVGIGDLSHAKILDFGCGSGHLVDFLRQEINYQGEFVGYDISSEMMSMAQKLHPECRFECRDILSQGVSEDFDYAIINGVFNNRISDNWGMMTAILETLFPHVQRGIAFNALSTYVDFFNPGNFYVSPEKVFHFCKERLSPCVSLRHDYEVKSGVVPFEYVVYVYRSPHAPRAELSA